MVWRADWPGSKPIETLVHRGTDIELEPQWYINGEQAASTNWTFQTFVQTNNQATGEWFGPLPGAAFSHTNDIGAAFYNVMVRAAMPGGGVNYTAFARLRMLDSPGFAPGELPLPAMTIDFSRVIALNAPWLLPAATNDIGTIRVELGSLSNGVSTLSAAVATNSADIATLKDTTATNSAAIATLKDTTATINSKIPSAASASNQLADKEWIDGEIDTYAAYYITYTAAGAAFPTRAALLNAAVVYSGGAVRTPTRNDYAVVLADESHGGAEWRYIYTVAAGATSGQWDAQYPIETNDYAGLANKPQINGVSLTGNKTGAQLDLQDALTAQQLANIAAVPEKANNSDVVHTTGAETIEGVKTFVDNMTAPLINSGSGAITIGLSGRIYQATAGGLIDDRILPNYGEVKSAISAAAQAATNYTDAAVSALSAITYDFATNVGLYTAVRDLIQALGGSVTNFPAIQQN
ncbi:MAG: hypothetical protein J6V72_20745 [Kiritimatiellae bacterium]|nr:hypothetical protein [Kiritimatiellia bacterium]